MWSAKIGLHEKFIIFSPWDINSSDAKGNFSRWQIGDFFIFSSENRAKEMVHIKYPAPFPAKAQKIFYKCHLLILLHILINP